MECSQRRRVFYFYLIISTILLVEGFDTFKNVMCLSEIAECKAKKTEDLNDQSAICKYVSEMKKCYEGALGHCTEDFKAEIDGLIDALPKCDRGAAGFIQVSSFLLGLSLLVTVYISS